MVRKTLDLTLDKEIQEAILSMPVTTSEGSPTTLEDILGAAKIHLQEAKRFLDENSLIKITAENILKSESCHGVPSFRVTLEGEIYLSVEQPEEVKPPRKEKLPPLGKIREKALELGLDVSGLGRQKLKILKMIEAAQPSEENA